MNIDSFFSAFLNVYFDSRVVQLVHSEESLSGATICCNAV